MLNLRLYSKTFQICFGSHPWGSFLWLVKEISVKALGQTMDEDTSGSFTLANELAANLTSLNMLVEGEGEEAECCSKVAMLCHSSGESAHHFLIPLSSILSELFIPLLHLSSSPLHRSRYGQRMGSVQRAPGYGP